MPENLVPLRGQTGGDLEPSRSSFVQPWRVFLRIVFSEEQGALPGQTGLPQKACRCFTLFLMALCAWVAAEVLRSPRETWALFLPGKSDVWPPPGTSVALQGADYTREKWGSVSEVFAFSIPGEVLTGERGNPVVTGNTIQHLSDWSAQRPARRLFLPGDVRCLTAFGGHGLVAGTGSSLAVWSQNAFQQGLPQMTLNLTGNAKALLTHPQGYLLAGTSAGLLTAWPSGKIQTGLSSLWSLKLSAEVNAIISLGALGLAVGTHTGLHLWFNASWTTQSPPDVSMAMGGVQSLLMLPNEGLAAGTGHQAGGTGHLVQIWPGWEAVMSGREAPLVLPTTGMASSLLLFNPTTLVAGTIAGLLNVWSNYTAGGPPDFSTLASSSVWAMLQLENGAIAACTIFGTVDLWPNVSCLSPDTRAPIVLDTSGPAHASLALPGLGLAVATGHARTVDLFPDLTGAFAQSLLGEVPVKSVPAPRARVGALAALPHGGIAAGTLSGGLLVWPNASTIASSSSRWPLRWDTPGPVNDLLVLGNGGLAAAAGVTVDIWASQGALFEGQPATFRLNASGWASALAQLSNDTLACGTTSMTIDVWTNIWAVTPSSPSFTLNTTAPVRALELLDDLGLAAANSDGTVEIWPISSLSVGLPPSIILKASGPIWCMLTLPGGGLAVGTAVPSVDVWPSSAAVQAGGGAPIRLPSSGVVLGLVLTNFGALVAGTLNKTLDFWPLVGQLRDGQAATATLATAQVVNSLLAMPNNTLAAGESFFLEFWPDALAMQGLPNPRYQITTGTLLSMSALGNLVAVGAALGTCSVLHVWKRYVGSEPAWEVYYHLDGLSLSVLLLPSGFVLVGSSEGQVGVWLLGPQGEALNHFNLSATGAVRAMTASEDYLAVACETPEGGALLLWPLSTLFEGPEPPAARFVNNLGTPGALMWWSNQLLVGWSHTLELWTFSAGLSDATSTRLQLPGRITALLNLTEDTVAVGMEATVGIWLSHDSLLQRSLTPDLTLLTPAHVASIALHDDGSLVAGGGRFSPSQCPMGTFSKGGQGGSCTFCPSGLSSLPGATNCLFPEPIIVLASSSTIFVLGLGLAVVSKTLQKRLGLTRKVAAGLGLLCSVVGAALLVISRAAITEWFVQLAAMLGCLLQIPDNVRKSDARSFIVLPLLIALVCIVEQVVARADSPILTPVGVLQPWESVPASTPMLALAVVFCWLAYLVPPTQARDVQALPKRPDTCRSFVCEYGEVLVSALGATVTMLQMGWQLMFFVQQFDPSRALFACATVAGALQLLLSFAVLIPLSGIRLHRRMARLVEVCFDRHCRGALVLQGVGLACKFLVLSLPHQETYDTFLWWQCQDPALCPSGCTEERGGTCSTATFQAEDGSLTSVCTCASFGKTTIFTFANCIVSICVGAWLTTSQVAQYWHLEPFKLHVDAPRAKLLAQVALVVAPFVAELSYLLLLAFANPACLLLSDVSLLIFSTVLLKLSANEVSKALETWGPDPDFFNVVRSKDYILILRPFAVLCSFAAALLSAARAASVGQNWPEHGVDCSHTQGAWVVIGLAFFVSSMAALISGPVVRPAETPER